MVHYSFPDIMCGFKISKDTLKKKCFSGEIAYKKLHWSKDNPDYFKYVIPESELEKLSKYKFAEPRFSSTSQLDFYEKKWREREEEHFYKMERGEYNAKSVVNYSEYLKSEWWQQLRTKRLKFDNWRCCMCGTGENLSVHHVTYERLGNEDLNDLITLCRDCHKKYPHLNDLREAKRS